MIKPIVPNTFFVVAYTRHGSARSSESFSNNSNPSYLRLGRWKSPDHSAVICQIGVVVDSDQVILVRLLTRTVSPAAFVAHPFYRRYRRIELNDRVLLSEFPIERTKPLDFILRHTYAAGSYVLGVRPQIAKRRCLALLLAHLEREVLEHQL